MGASCACVSGKRQPPNRKSDYSLYPDDLLNYQPVKRPNLPKIKFDALLYNIVIINYPKSSTSLKFCIDGIVEVPLPKKSQPPNSNEIKWISKEKFNFNVDEYELRVKFLTVYINDDDKNKQVLKINLYKLATGPYHNDFSIIPSKPNVRLKFDFKVSQYVQIKVNCKETYAELKQKSYPGQSFHFTIRVLKEENEEPFQSNPSYIHMNPYQKSEKSQQLVSQYDQCPSPIKIRGRQPPKPMIIGCNFVWLASKGEMPNFTINLKSDQIEKTILHSVIWRAEGEVDVDDIKQPNNKENDDDVDMFCEAYTPFIKILQNDPVYKNDNGVLTNIQRVLEIKNQGLWSDGQKIGQLSMKIAIQNSAFIKQMKACTRTQAGIIESTPLFRSYFVNSSKETKLQKSIKIEQMLANIQQHNKEINQNSQLSYYHQQKLKDKMIEQFEKIKKFYEADLESSFYVPSTQEQASRMVDEQSEHLSVVLRVMGYAEDDETLTDVCWRIISVILRRGEFELNNIGFNKNDQLEMKKGLTNYYKKKLKVALEFQQIQYKLLLQSLRVGYIEGRDDPRQAVQMFRAYAYFRVPCYREIILRKVVRKEDSAIQWNTNIADEDIETMPEAQNILSTQLDWENNFYKPLEIDSKSQALTKQMLQNLEGSLWLEQISKRGSTFFYFLYFLISKLSQLGKRIKFIKWQYFPGYNKLVRAFLFEMKNIKVERYPPSMVQTSIYLLNNEKLLNILITMVFEKTNANDPNGVMKGLDLISRYLNHFSKNKKPIPPSFNYVYFFKAVKIILQGEFAFGIIKMLSIIFMNYDNFNVEFKKNLSLYLLGKVFFRLFLNWSFTIRKAFYHVLILKIQRTSDVFDSESRRQFSNNHQIMNEITTRYRDSLKVVRKALEVHRNDNSDKFRKNDQQLYKKLRRKMALKKKKGDQKIANGYNDQPQNIYTRKQSGKSNGSDITPRIQSKYSINELLKSTYPERSQSVRLDPSILKIAMENVKRQSKNPPPGEELEVNRTRSGSAYNEIPEEENRVAPRKLRQRKRSIYGMDEFEMKDMDRRQLQYLPAAIAQFDDLDQAIRKYYRQNSELPICELDVQVPIDEKEIKPLSADFEEWQASQSSDQS